MKKTATPSNSIRLLCSVLLTATISMGCASSSRKASAMRRPLFRDSGRANLIIRYTQDSTSYLERPLRMEGPFYSIITRDQLLREAEQPELGRELAVIVLGDLAMKEVEERIILGWEKDLARLNYNRVVFLAGSKSWRVDGREIIRTTDLKTLALTTR